MSKVESADDMLRREFSSSHNPVVLIESNVAPFEDDERNSMSFEKRGDTAASKNKVDDGDAELDLRAKIEDIGHDTIEKAKTWWNYWGNV